MGRSIIKQPNGKYAVWSTIVDNFIMINYEPVREKEVEVRDFVMNYVEGTMPNRRDFEDCIETIKLIHGESEVAEVLSNME